MVSLAVFSVRQLSKKLNNRIKNNSGKTKNKWEEHRWRLLECNEKKKHYSDLEKWDNAFSGYESYIGMPAIGTTLYTWQWTQLSNGNSSLNDWIRKYPEEKKEWEERRQRPLSATRGKRALVILKSGIICIFI